MHFIKSLFRGLASIGFKTLLFLIASSAAVLVVAGNRTALKNTLSKTGIYDKVTDVVVESAHQESSNNPGSAGSQTAFENHKKELSEIAKQAFPSTFLQSSTEQVVDGVFNWLEGKAVRPDFRLDLTDAKQRFVDGWASFATTKARSLPACPGGQGTDGTNFDPLSATCLPIGANPDLIGQQAKEKLLSSNDFLGNTVITADSIGHNENNKGSVFDRLSFAPEVYSIASRSPLILGFVALLLAVTVIFLSQTIRKGFRSVAWSLLSAGVFILITTFLISYLFARANQVEVSGQLASQTRDLIVTAINTVSKNINRTLYIYGGGYLFSGLIMLGGLRLTKPKGDVTEELSEAEKEIIEKSQPVEEPAPSPQPISATTHQPAPLAKPKAGPKRIQG